MESNSGAGVAIATAQTHTLPMPPWENRASPELTIQSAVVRDSEGDKPGVETMSSALLNEARPARFVDHSTASDLRSRANESGGNRDLSPIQTIGNETAINGPPAAANDHSVLTSGAILSTEFSSADMLHPDTKLHAFDPDAYGGFLPNMDAPVATSTEQESGLTLPSANPFDVPAQENEKVQAYALLKFSDGDFYVKSYQVVIGRDMGAWKQYQRERKRVIEAQRAVEEYRQEPSQPSQRGDDDIGAPGGDPSSKSSAQSLEGRPAKSLPSNFSETGGIMRVDADSDDELDNRRKRRKRGPRSFKSSSTTSVAPASLHPAPMCDISSYGNPFLNASRYEQPECVKLEVHPMEPEDMRFISREHLLLYFNFENQRWELKVTGNGAFISDVFHPKDSVIPLYHGDEVMVKSVRFIFKLPDHEQVGDEAVEAADTDESEAEDKEVSPSLRALNAVTESENDEDEDEDSIDDGDALPARKREKKSNLKLKLGRRTGAKQEETAQKPVMLSLKAQSRKMAPGGSPELDFPTEVKAYTKGKHPKKSTKEPARAPGQVADAATPIAEAVVTCNAPKEEEVGGDSQIQTVKERSGTPALPQFPENIPAGSVFEGVKPEELPQKRKGPGRPPKNGLISKRDEAFIKRKKKEYEKSGLPVPALDQLLAEVRRENKEKEAAAKAAAAFTASGEQPVSVLPGLPQTPILQPASNGDTPAGIVKSTEAADVSNSVTKARAAATDKATGDKQAPKASDSSGFDQARKTSPKPRRMAKSPSPQKPESAYTEDELKKPTQTYIFLIDEALRGHSTGVMDLQEIYDKICKRYPYYKYRAGTSGWQSSVRHNLISCERFVEAGKQGKGRLWKINYDFAIEKDKKKKPDVEIRPPLMQSGSHPPGQYGNYQAPYVQHPGGHLSSNQRDNGHVPAQYAGQQHGAQYSSQYLQGGPVQMGQSRAPYQRPHQQPPLNNSSRPQAPAAKTSFEAVVQAIMEYRQRYLGPFVAGTPLFSQHEELFKKCTNLISRVYQGEEVRDEEVRDEERRVFADMKDIIKRITVSGNGDETANRLNSEPQQQQQVATASPNTPAAETQSAAQSGVSASAQQAVHGSEETNSNYVAHIGPQRGAEANASKATRDVATESKWQGQSLSALPQSAPDSSSNKPSITVPAPKDLQFGPSLTDASDVPVDASDIAQASGSTSSATAASNTSPMETAQAPATCAATESTLPAKAQADADRASSVALSAPVDQAVSVPVPNAVAGLKRSAEEPTAQDEATKRTKT